MPPSMAESPSDGGAVTVGADLEPVVETFEKLGDPLAFAMTMDRRVVPARREHRVEGEGDKEGDEDGKGDGHPELEEEAADNAAHVGDGDKDGDDRHRGGKDRQADLTRAEA